MVLFYTLNVLGSDPYWRLANSKRITNYHTTERIYTITVSVSGRGSYDLYYSENERSLRDSDYNELVRASTGERVAKGEKINPNYRRPQNNATNNQSNNYSQSGNANRPNNYNQSPNIDQYKEPLYTERVFTNKTKKRSNTNTNEIAVTAGLSQDEFSKELNQYLQSTPKNPDKQGTIIGTYAKHPVYKKGDTIIVTAINKKYLLSLQTPLENKSEYGDYQPIVGLGNVTEDGWYLGKDLNENNNVIGYITTTSRRSNSSAERESFAKNSTGHKFYTIDCDRTICKKFIDFCEFEICRKINTMNVEALNYTEFIDWIEQEQDILEAIQWNSLVDIIAQIVIDELKNGLKGKEGKLFSIVSEVVNHLDDSLFDCLVEFGSDLFFMPMGNEYTDDIKKAKDCVISIMKPFIREEIKNSIEYKITSEISLKDFLTDKVKIHNEGVYTFSEDVVTKTINAIAKSIKYTDDCTEAFGIKDAIFKNSQTRILYHIVKNAQPLVKIFQSAGAHIGYSVEGERIRKDILQRIKRAEQQVIFLEDCKKRYQTMFDASRNNCHEFNAAVNKLYEEVNSLGTPYTQEVLTKMKDYVFGNKIIIGKCYKHRNSI